MKTKKMTYTKAQKLYDSAYKLVSKMEKTPYYMQTTEQRATIAAARERMEQQRVAAAELFSATLR